MLPPVSPTSSEDALEQGLFPYLGMGDKAELLCCEGGVQLLLFLIVQAVSPTANATTDPKTWVYRNITHLPQLEQHEWQRACLRELEAL